MHEHWKDSMHGHGNVHVTIHRTLTNVRFYWFPSLIKIYHASHERTHIIYYTLYTISYILYIYIYNILPGCRSTSQAIHRPICLRFHWAVAAELGDDQSIGGNPFRCHHLHGWNEKGSPHTLQQLKSPLVRDEHLKLHRHVQPCLWLNKPKTPFGDSLWVCLLMKFPLCFTFLPFCLLTAKSKMYQVQTTSQPPRCLF